MSYIIEGCSTLTSPNTYTIEFVGNDIIFFNPRPIITIEYLAPHSYLIHMDSNISFTTFTNNSNKYIGVSCGTFNIPPFTVCGATIMNNYDIVRVKFNTQVDNFNVNDYYQFKIGILLDGVTVQAYARAFRTKSPLMTTIPQNDIINDTNINDDIINDIINDMSDTFNDCCKKVKIPRLIIEGQANVDGTNLGDMKFIIEDKYTYYNHKSIIGTKCGKFTINPKKLKETIFRKYGKSISLNSVLKGKGCNALEKSQYIYKKDKKLEHKVSFYNFYYDNLTLYAMSKYILSYLLYGNFDINYLLGKYDKDFYKNLRNSRFCHFIDLYTDDKNLKSYNKYFKYE